jgi:phosphohistidine phosphatase
MRREAIPHPADVYDRRMIWLLRHGEAEDGEGKDDADRVLTDKGRRQSKWAGRALAELGVELDACLTSPKARALDTARIACEQIEGVEPEIEEVLAGGGFELAAVAEGRGEVLLVGHEPDLSNAIAAVTGGTVKLKKGGVAAVEGGELHLLARPADLKRIAG